MARPSGSSSPSDGTHSVGSLLADGDPAASGPVGVGGGRAVLVEEIGQPLGGGAQRVGSEFGGELAELFLGFLAGLVIDAVGQLVEEPSDDADMLGTDLPGGLGGRRGGQPRVQTLARQRGCPTQVGCLADAALGLFGADAQPDGQRLGQTGSAQRLGGRFDGQLVDQGMFDRW